MADVESAVTTVQTFQQILLGLAALSMTAYRFPADTATDDLQCKYLLCHKAQLFSFVMHPNTLNVPSAKGLFIKH